AADSLQRRIAHRVHHLGNPAHPVRTPGAGPRFARLPQGRRGAACATPPAPAAWPCTPAIGATPICARIVSRSKKWRKSTILLLRTLYIIVALTVTFLFVGGIVPIGPSSTAVCVPR